MTTPVKFIGRDDELTQARQLLLEFGTTRFLFLIGDGGIGKTRFLEEFRTRINEGQYNSNYLTVEHRIVLVQEFTDSEWSKEFIGGITSMAAELGVNLEMTDAKHLPDRMAADLAEKIDSRPGAIIISLGSFPKIETEIRRAVNLGIPVFTFDNHLPDVEGDVVKVFQDDLQGLQLVSTLMLKEMGYQGKIAVIWSRNNSLQQRRYNDLKRLLLNYNRVQVFEVDCEMSSRSEASASEQIRLHLIKHPDTKAIWCVFDEFARGVVQGLKELNRRDIKLYSFDLCPTDKRLMLEEDSPWRACAAIDPAQAGRLMVRLALQHIIVSPRPTERYYSLPLELVTQETLRTVDKQEDWYSLEEKGWSPELRAIEAYERTHYQSLYSVADVIDFADPDLALEGAIEQRLEQIAGDMAPKNLILDLQTLELQARLLQPDLTALQRDRVQQDLLEGLNAQSRDKRLVLCFDTTERATEQILATPLVVNVLCKVKNMLVIFAGRPEPIMNWLIDEISRKQSSEVVRHNLLPFDVSFSVKYLQEKQGILALELPRDLTYTLAGLSRGKPILLDLAIEYISRDIELDKLPERHVLEAMSSEDLNQAAESFERYLVQHIRKLRHEMDQLVLRLSRIFPLSVEGIASVFQIPLAEATRLFEEARTYAFIRTIYRRDGSEIELHDEMRRLIDTYIWEQYDKDKAQRRRDSLRAVKYYREQDDALKKLINRYEAQIRVIDRDIAALKVEPSLDESTQIELQSMKVKLESGRKATRSHRHAVTIEWVKHMFFAQQKGAFQEWVGVIDKVRIGRHYQFTMRLCAIITDYVPQMTESEQQEYAFRYARALLDLGETSDGIEHLEHLERLLKRRARGNKDLLSNTYNMLGVAYLRLNQITRAREYQEKCLKLIDPERKGPRAQVLNQIGYCLRLQAEENPRYRKAAQKRYDEVLVLATEAQEQLADELQLRQMHNLIASTNNNLAYLYGMNRYYDRAETLLARAITIWQELGEEAERARAEITLGILARDRGRYELSRQHLERAIRLIPDTDKSDKQHQAYFHLGWTEWFDAVDRTDKVRVDGLEQAERLLRRSLRLAEENGHERSKPGIYHQLASVLWRLGREMDLSFYCDEARQLNQKALDLGKQLEDRRYYVDSLVGEAEFDLDLQDDSRLDQYVKDLAEYEQNYFFPLYYGRMYRIRAEFALRQGNTATAFALYSKGIALINEHGGFGPYTVEKELYHLSEFVRRMPRPEADQYLRQMLQEWKQWKYREPGVNRYDLVFWCNNELSQLKLRTTER